MFSVSVPGKYGTPNLTKSLVNLGGVEIDGRETPTSTALTESTAPPRLMPLLVKENTPVVRRRT